MNNTSDTHRLEFAIPKEELPDVLAALKAYGIRTGAEYGRMCVHALIRAHKAGDTLSLPLRFEQAR
jgi:hypothetical protein